MASNQKGKFFLFISESGELLADSLLIPAGGALLFLASAGYLPEGYAHLSIFFLLPVIVWEVTRRVAVRFARSGKLKPDGATGLRSTPLLILLVVLVGLLLIFLQTSRPRIAVLAFYILLGSLALEGALTRLRETRFFFIPSILRFLSATLLAYASFGLNNFVFDLRYLIAALSLGFNGAAYPLASLQENEADSHGEPQTRRAQIYGALLLLAPCAVAMLVATRHLPKLYLLPLVVTIVIGQVLRSGPMVRLPSRRQATAFALLFPALVLLSGILTSLW